MANDINRLIDMLYERIEDAKAPALKPNMSIVERDEMLDLLDELKEVVKEHRFESFEARQESRKMQFDVTDNQFEHDLYQTIYTSARL